MDTGTIVIVGAGQAGGMAAAHLRTMAYDGRIVIVGDEPHPPYERPPLSKAALQDGYDAAAPHLHPAGFYADNRIELRLGARAVVLDAAAREVVLDDGSRLGFDRCLIATGGVARELPGLPRGAARVHYVRTLADAGRLRGCMTGGRRIGVVGGGFLGLEVASTARAAGADVLVIEPGERLLPRALPPHASAWLRSRVLASDTRLLLGTALAGARAADDGVTLELAGGERLTVDDVVVAIGMTPDVALAEAAGIALDAANGGIRVDEACRTSVPAVYAAGDCASQHRSWLGGAARLESWQNANEQARTAAAAMLGQPLPAPPYPWFWTDQFGCNLQILGVPAADLQYVARAVTAPDDAAPRGLWLGHRDGVPVHGVAVNAGGDLRQLRVLFEQAVALDVQAFADPAHALKPLVKAAQAAASSRA